MNLLLPGIIMSFREGLEAFLIITILLNFLNRTNNRLYRKSIWCGAAASFVFSILIGSALFAIAKKLDSLSVTGKLWESIASLSAVALMTTLIVWMIKHLHAFKNEIEAKMSRKLSAVGIFVLTFVLVAREGVEIAIFSFAGDYTLVSILVGLGLALVIVLGISFSLIRIRLNLLLNVTLIYLILQAGYLLGYGLHEGLSALKTMGKLPQDSFFLVKVFDFSGTVLDHKMGIAGLPLSVLSGWYSKPEWLQLMSQLILVISLLSYWRKSRK